MVYNLQVRLRRKNCIFTAQSDKEIDWHSLRFGKFFIRTIAKHVCIFVSVSVETNCTYINSYEWLSKINFQ